MRFLYPEVLYALFALTIPVIVHLFRFRPVRKEWFTNVAFLKRLEVKTQRVSKLKKRLLLASRLLMLSAIILAFARPVSSDILTETETGDTVIFLDNSLSMQAEGNNGSLLEEAVQTLLSEFPPERSVKIFTNNSEFPISSIETLRNELIGTPYSPVALTDQQLKLKLQSYLTNDRNTVLLLSDFKDFTPATFDSLRNASVYAAIFKSLPAVNVSADTLSVEKSAGGWQIKVQFSTGNAVKDVPVSIWNGQELLAKSTFSTAEATQKTETFDLPDKDLLHGRVEVEDDGYLFDNELYFSLKTQEKIKVLVIGDTLSNYLKRIYTPDEFILEHLTPQAFDTDLLEESDFVILNEVQSFPSGLSETLVEKVSKGGGLFIVLPPKPDVNAYRFFLSALGNTRMENTLQGSFQITEISTLHPVFAEVFEKNISNFDFPTAKSYIQLAQNGVTPLLQFANNDVFFGALSNQVFIITASLQPSNSNFQKSPLIVPTFYSTARNSLHLPSLYVTIGKNTRVDIKTRLNQDEVLQIPINGSPYIPLQRFQQNSVNLTFEDVPAEPGHCPVLRQNDTLQILAFNYMRTENRALQSDILSSDNEWVNSGSPNQIFKELIVRHQHDEFWKWFVIFALVFFMAETLIIKLLP